ncbi:prepilin peptidase [Novosphingobium sp. KCTC 2891]|uniref:A24 family peptidase n=1 Tax=Novosphingobium sp. KCTC 2891 TaxID=2989730 RepID=UPI0022214FEC|nr:prepilin peptidase [Novosphingobium sp. KCTC 2891]
MIQQIPLAVLALLGAVGMIFDVRWRRLPNWLSLLTMVSGLAVCVLTAAPDTNMLSTIASHVAHGLVALVAGMVLFRLGAVGGGDAKFYAALAMWLPLSRAALFLGVTAGAGLVSLALWFLARRIAGRRVAGRHGDAQGKFPFGVAIALGALGAFAIG